ncbi:MAG: hypothetical protein E7411_00855 [Ruminococcaceae bacterium]|nr:hypothetical protein [Oscillospiraceae bacterium]
MSNLNEDLFERAKNKINSALSDRQKSELMEKIKGIDKASLKGMLKTINPDKIEDPDLKEFIKDLKSNF